MYNHRDPRNENLSKLQTDASVHLREDSFYVNIFELSSSLCERWKRLTYELNRWTIPNRAARPREWIQTRSVYRICRDNLVKGATKKSN
jgi:hypothetical protein